MAEKKFIINKLESFNLTDKIEKTTNNPTLFIWIYRS